MGKFVRDEELIAYKVRDTQLTRLSETLAGEAIYRFSFSGAAENDYSINELHRARCHQQR